MGKVIKLREFRKRKAKAEREKQADVNRRLHGRTKSERAREDLQKQQLTRTVDGARLTPPSEAADSGIIDDSVPDDGVTDDGVADDSVQREATDETEAD